MANVRQLASGKWQAQVRKAGFKPVVKSFSTKALAEHWAKNEELRIERGIAGLQTDQMTVASLFTKWRDEVAPKRKGERHDTIRINFLLREWPPHLLAMDVNHIQLVSQLRSYRDRRLEAGVSGSTVGREMSLISSVFSYAAKEGWIEIRSNPISLVSRPAENKPRKQRCSDEELALITGGFPTTPPDRNNGTTYLPHFAYLAVETAMRLNEIISLRWDDINTKDKTVHVRDEWVPGKGGKSVKNGCDRDVPLSSRAIQILKLLAEGADEDDEDVFMINTAYAGELWRRATAKVGLSHIHFHDLRREATTRIAEVIDNVMELSAITGHKDLRILQAVYYKPSITKLAEKLG